MDAADAKASLDQIRATLQGEIRVAINAALDAVVASELDSFGPIIADMRAATAGYISDFLVDCFHNTASAIDAEVLAAGVRAERAHMRAETDGARFVTPTPMGRR